MKRESLCILFTVLLTVALFFCNLFVGTVDIPYDQVCDILLGKDGGKESWRFIVMESRLPQALTATLCGAALATSGLMLQTVFRNPLAGPSILGIDSGASVGVAIVMLLNGGSMLSGNASISGTIIVTIAAFIGALCVMGILLFFASILRHNTMLLITGIMLSYITSSTISLLNFFSTSEGTHSYLIWGMGSFGGVSLGEIPMFSTLTVAGLFIAIMLVKPLNALLLGNYYAENLGIDVRQTRYMLLLSTGLLSAATTAFCGPISFLGLAVPHVARLILGRSDHRLLLPLTMLCGCAVALLCNCLCLLPGDSGTIPLSAVTPLIGAPVILYVLLRPNHMM